MITCNICKSEYEEGCPLKATLWNPEHTADIRCVACRANYFERAFGKVGAQRPVTRFWRIFLEHESFTNQSCASCPMLVKCITISSVYPARL